MPEGLRWKVTKAVRSSRLPSTTKLVMFVLADVADTGTAEIPPHRTPSLTVLAKETGLARSTVAAQLLALEKAGWVVRTRPETAAALGQFERTRYQLMVPASEPSPDDGLPSAGDGPSLVQEMDHPSPTTGPPSATVGHRYRSYSDEELTTPEPSSSKALALADEHRPDVEKICRHLADRIHDNGSKRPNITKKWRDEARRLIDLDNRTVDQIIRAIDWCQNDEFWRANILSMPKLREKYEQLRLAAQRANGRGKPSTTDQRVGAALALAAQLEEQEDLHG